MKRIFLKDYTHAQKLAAPVASREENGEAADKRANKPCLSVNCLQFGTKHNVLLIQTMIFLSNMGFSICFITLL